MNEKAIEKTSEQARGETRPQAKSGEHADEPGGHPLDTWLRRELRQLGPASAAEPLPPGMAALAERLEARLREAEDRPDGDDDRPDADQPEGRRRKGADRARTS